MKILFVRATLHDSTNAIPRAVEAAHGLFESMDVLCWDRLAMGLPSQEEIDGLRIERFQGTASPRSLWIALLTLKYQWWVLRHILKRRRVVVQVLDFESALPATLACALTGSKLIYDVRDPVTLSYGVGPVLRISIHIVESFIMWRSDAFVVPAANRIAYLGKWPSRGRALAVVRNTCHDQLADMGDETSKPPTGTPVTIAYLGYITHTRGTKWLIDFVRSTDCVELLVAGYCRATDLLANLNTCPRASWMGLVSKLDALRMMRRSSAVALLYDPAIPVNRMAAPNKFYESLMVGTPVLVSRGMGIGDEVERYGLGFVINYGDSKELLQAVAVLSDPHMLRELRSRCRNYFHDQCQIEGDMLHYRQFYEKFF